MVQLILPNEILNDTPADATPVEQNYSYIQSHINQQMINRDGSVAMTGQLHLVGDPVNVLDAATKGYVDAILPIGVILPFGGAAAPAGAWATCNGATLTIASYPKLYAVLGTRFGSGTGTFKLPNMAGRFPIGVDSTQASFNVVGETGGTWDVPVPPHAHPMPHTHTMAHTHEHPHNHPINHGHAPVTSAAGGAHDHAFSYVADQNTGEAGSGARIVGYVGSGLHADVDTQAAHTHVVDLPTSTGLISGSPTEATTGASSAGSTGAVSTANTANNTDALTTGTIATTHMPPFVTVYYIIRIG
jgi:microcystin-dependent protein